MKIIAITPVSDKTTVGNMIIQGLNDLGCNVIATYPGNSVINHYNDDDVVRQSKDADYVFVFWGKESSYQPGFFDKIAGRKKIVYGLPKYYLLDRINRPEITAYIDESEWTSTGYPDTGGELSPAYWTTNKNGLFSRQKVEAKYNPKRCKGEPWLNEKMLNSCKWYFKRECYPEDKKMGIIPLNVGCWNEYFSGIEIKKDIDIFCSFGQLDTGLRYEVFHFCRKLAHEGFKVKFVGMGKEKVDFRTYQELIARSYIGLSAWGAGNSCRRLFEVMAGKTCCFAQKTEIEFIHKPEDGVHYVEYSTMAEFMDKIYHYLYNKKTCIEIGQKGYDFVKEYHAPIARVKYMLEIMSKNK
ncbi:hypothetical protein A2303_04625 [Candidatus Falkowbacteria bacterium RIFOXYB2_FULL_47_14]|uniref:Spore protein YkvP/CgeB glycosyl transferase-like domain-containing protein n=1 Tax=Candidatus Falkowbacteria bacterium RIFOXYA2_FULL_47_19 TaxID=1797994 RepID=A0A1F5SH54_9BACT|nr:MAG: hypothetical protein A2227_02460 [Candidatus Falkowbacteria bacterium RIFOXYA2_FULL_47_19]OGF42660.1 MAG: hypothetical protein A2303_04625 [Candidatus Falkowbacteria bacterium RIFOXYB2_FULL_47_14]